MFAAFLGTFISGSFVGWLVRDYRGWARKRTAA